jgi:hypothetical protein
MFWSAAGCHGSLRGDPTPVSLDKQAVESIADGPLFTLGINAVAE